MLLFKDILTFLGLDYKYALLITVFQNSDQSDNLITYKLVVKRV